MPISEEDLAFFLEQIEEKHQNTEWDRDYWEHVPELVADIRTYRRLILAWMKDIRTTGDPTIVSDATEYTSATDALIRWGMVLENVGGANAS